MIEDREPEPTTEPFRFEARIAGGRSPWPVAGFVIALVVLAVAKPWAPDRPAGSSRVTATDRPASPASPSTVPARPSPSNGVEAVAGICLEPGSWRTTTIEMWHDQTVRVWRALDPSEASGPTDPTIPMVPAVGTSVPAIGYCAPGVGTDVPAGALDVDAWSVAAGRASPLALRQVDPVGIVSPFGALYGPPGRPGPGGGAPSATWPDGVVVFRLTERASRLERWFSIEVRGVGAPEADGPGPAAASPAVRSSAAPSSIAP
jgi:hypothetical protein